MMNLQIRLAAEEDVDAITRIYNHYVDCSTCTFQMRRESTEDRLAWLRAHDAEHPVTVCDHDGNVVAWASLSPWNSRCAYAGTVETSVYVHHDWHRQGLGKKLLVDLIERARNLGYHILIGGACTEQVASIKLQESLGFSQVACFREVGRKFDRWLDVIYLQLALD